MLAQVLYALGVVGADRDPDGKFRVYGAPPVVGLGGDEVVIGSEVEYAFDGRRCSLAGLMNGTSYGCRNVEVIA